MRLRTLGAVCATSAAAVPLLDVVPSASAQEPTPPAQPAAAPPPVQPGAAPGDMRSAVMATLTNRHVYFARRYHRLLGDPLSLPERRTLRQEVSQLQPPALRHRTKELRGDIRSLRRKLDRKLDGGAPDIPIPPQLSSIAECESGGDPRAVSAGGTYRGKYQFSFSTWRSVGGKGDPAAATETEQDRRAAKLYLTGGPGHWPVCGR
jgi:transglycosylase-like protein